MTSATDRFHAGCGEALQDVNTVTRVISPWAADFPEQRITWKSKLRSVA